MKRSFFFVGLMGAILVTRVFVQADAALPQAASRQPSLLQQASIVFSGTVSQFGATSFAEVPKSPQTIVVRVVSVLKKPPAVSLKSGDKVTVEVKDPSAFQEGTNAIFYTDGWMFGSGVAVKELGHEMGLSSEATKAAAGEKTKPQGTEQISDQELENRLKSADFVVIGHVTDVRRWRVPKSVPYRVTEHDPDWHEAIVEIQSVLKGGKVKGNKLVVRFAQCNDVAWARAPKLEKNQRGIFFLDRDQVSGAPMTKLGGQQVNAYTCLRHSDYLPMSDEARVRSLLKSQ